MKRIYLPLLILAIALSGFKTFETQSWNLDEDYSIKFTSDNPEGIFQKMEGTIVFDEDNLGESYFDMEVDAATISTGNGMKNKHAMSDKWFDVKTHPKITFKSSEITEGDEGYTVTGTLNIHGKEKELSFPFTFEDDVFKGSFDIDRTEYELGPTSGMQGNKAAKVLKVELEVPVSQD